MKIEQLVVQHLYQYKEVTLQGIGTFNLNPAVALPAEGDKEFVMPDDAFQFTYNLKATEDEHLIEYIVKNSGKIKPLASADLDSYVTLAKQFLNIGKPFRMEGIGTIQKNQQGEYVFTGGQFITPKIDDIPKQIREKRDETVSFESESRKDNSRRNIMIVSSLLIVTLLALGVYYFVFKKKPAEDILVTEPVVQQTAPVTADTVKTDTSRIDSALLQKSDSGLLPQPATVVNNDRNNFKIVIKTYTSQPLAQKAFNRLTNYGHKLEIVNKDSSNYKLIMTFSRPLTDTTKVRDSVRILFGGRPSVEL